eukprot:9684198-Ditylum_brightwellii.AAC.1
MRWEKDGCKPEALDDEIAHKLLTTKQRADVSLQVFTSMYATDNDRKVHWQVIIVVLMKKKIYG